MIDFPPAGTSAHCNSERQRVHRDPFNAARRPVVVRALGLCLLGVVATARAQTAADAPGDPAKVEVILPAAVGWQANLIHNDDVGVWTVGAVKAFPLNGCPEVFALDDKGRCRILSCYSQRWTAWETVKDDEWLGSFAAVDLDPQVGETELYTGGKRGNLYRIVTHRDGGLDTALIARFPAEELHTAAAGDLLPTRPGNELLIFTHLGNVYDIRPDPASPSGFRGVQHARLDGRVRQAIVLQDLPGEAGTGGPWIAAATRNGQLQLLRMREQGMDVLPILDEPMGFGRIAIRPPAAGQALVLYATRDDGVVLRLERRADGSFSREAIYTGPQGPRGIAAGHFDADPATETIAVYGYSKKVQLLSRRQGQPWRVETLFVDIDRGHWLQAIEVDGRNATDELIASGYSGRVVLLARETGYGMPGIPTERDAADPAAAATMPAPASSTRVPRLGIASSATSPADLSPLGYRGGFETKTLLFDTLVRQDPDGHIVPGIAAAWRIEDDGRAFVFTLRDDLTFADGTPVDARAVRLHFERFAALPEHAWLRSVPHIISVTAPTPHEVKVTLDQPRALLPDLCAINPCSIQAPSAYDREGRWLAPVGTGPYRLVSMHQGVMQLTRVESARPDLPARLDLVVLDPARPTAAMDAFVAGDIDAFADGAYELVPRDRLDELVAMDGVEVVERAGSTTVYLAFNKAGPAGQAECRRAIAAALDRRALIRASEYGHADARSGFARDGKGHGQRPIQVGPQSIPALVLLVRADTRDATLARAIAGQLGAAGLTCTVAARDAAAYATDSSGGAWDLRIERTWGIPYDPYVSMTHRLLPPVPDAAATGGTGEIDAELVAAAARVGQLADPAQLEAALDDLNRRIDDDATFVPLFVPRRLAVFRRAAIRIDIGHDLYRLTPLTP